MSAGVGMAARALDLFKSRQARGFLALLAYGFSIAANFLASGHPFIGASICLLAVIVSILLFWKEIRLLRIAYPKGTVKVESPIWLYIFGLIGLGTVLIAGYRIWDASHKRPDVITSDLFSQTYISGKYIRIADFADSNNEIQGRTFEDSYIYGPAVLYVTDHTIFGNNSFNGSSDQVFIPVVDGGVIQAGDHTGIILIKDSTFKRCHFIAVSLVVTKLEEDEMKKGFR